jgi:glycerol-3-phosphate dehydrogenase subunit B
MALTSDVLVIGGGLAGSTAALAAAREGTDVRIVSAAENTLRQASGLIDVLGYPPRTGRDRGRDATPIVDPFDAIPDLPMEHPYRTVGVDAVRDGLALFDAVTGETYRGDHTDRNALVPTAGGRVKPTARYPAGVAPGLATDGRDALLVGFESLPVLDAPLAADRLEADGVPFEVRGVTTRFPADFRADATATRYAHALDVDEATADGRSIRDALAAAIGPHLDGEDRVGLPPILGSARHGEVRAHLERTLDVAVFEVPAGPPSLPGIRLESSLREALSDAGVVVSTGTPVVDATVDDDRIETVTADRDGQAIPYRAEEYVLATGGLVGTGVESDREAVSEPVFDCHVPHPDERDAWFEDDAFGSHAFARFGVRTDGALRPLDADGDPEFANLRAAGAVLGGYDLAAERSGSGVSIATGYAAGIAAAREVGE